MDTARRRFLVAGTLGAGGLMLSACMPSGPDVLSVAAQAQPGMNPGADGADRPVTVNVVQMTGTGAFNSSDIIALQNPSAALGGEFVKADRLVLAPGASTTSSITLDPRATAIGVTAGFISPTGKTVRTTVPVSGGNAGLSITVGPGGISAAST